MFWNNFDYYRKSSPVKTVSSGFGPAQIQYPVGVGVLIFGGTGWVIKDNSIFGNFLIGRQHRLGPDQPTGKAINNDNQFMNNKMGAAFNDANGTDFFNDGSGRGSCFANNGAVTLYSAADDPNSQLYPTCPATTGSGTTTGDPDQLQVVGSNREPDLGAGEVLARSQAPGASGGQALRGLGGHSMMKHKGLTTLIACVAVGAVGVPTALGTTPKKKPVVKNVQVRDDFYTPTKVTVKKGQQVNWIWNKNNFDTHTVTLIKGPKGRQQAQVQLDPGQRGDPLQADLHQGGDLSLPVHDPSADDEHDGDREIEDHEGGPS